MDSPHIHTLQPVYFRLNGVKLKVNGLTCCGSPFLTCLQHGSLVPTYFIQVLVGVVGMLTNEGSKCKGLLHPLKLEFFMPVFSGSFICCSR